MCLAGQENAHVWLMIFKMFVYRTAKSTPVLFSLPFLFFFFFILVSSLRRQPLDYHSDCVLDYGQLPMNGTTAHTKNQFQIQIIVTIRSHLTNNHPNSQSCYAKLFIVTFFHHCIVATDTIHSLVCIACRRVAHTHRHIYKNTHTHTHTLTTVQWHLFKLPLKIF